MGMNNSNVRVAYTGVEGAFAHIAAGKIMPDATRVSYHSFRSAYMAVVNGECDYAVLPIENSFAGEVGQVMDLLFEGDLYIRGIYSLHVTQNLLGVKGSSEATVKKVISHYQALDQCCEYLGRMGYETETATNTAAAAKQVALMKDERIAAIASLETAKLYGLDVIKANINDVADNTTKFAVLERRMSEIIDRDSDKIDVYAIMFTIPNEPGGLAKILMTLVIFGYNMRVIRSRPLKGHNWTYYFYTEAEGDKSSLGQAMIEGLKKNCQMVKVLGHYTEVDELK